MKKIAVKELESVYRAIAKDADLFLPVKKTGQTDFCKWEEGDKVDIHKLKTTKSAKNAFFPQVQDLVKFQVSGKEINVEEPVLPDKKQVIFGVKACDVRSFDILDMAFTEDFPDTFYQARRDNTTIVSLACNKPDESCFCKVYGIDASQPKGDVSTWIVGDYMYLEPITEKGTALIEKLGDLLLDADDKDAVAVEDAKKSIKEVIDRLPYSNLDLTGFDGEHLMEKFNSDKWGDLSSACLGCGTCTFVCPTCQCYDIRDFKTKNGVTRFKCWDSCMYSDFTLAAAGQPRPTQMQRYRQRFMHKLVYFPSNHDGVYSCVGCGRCVQKCPQMLNIVKVIKVLGEKKDDE